MDKQVSLSGLSDELTQVRTKRKELLSQMERIVLWGEWPYYYKGESGNKTCEFGAYAEDLSAAKPV